ncbi:hypothetical protein ACSBR2_000107 [Camellia fascicularis]
MELHTLPDAKSRGDLPLRFVEVPLPNSSFSFFISLILSNRIVQQHTVWLQSTKSLREFAEEAVEEAHQYNGFNLIIADLSSETWFMSPTGQRGT